MEEGRGQIAAIARQALIRREHRHDDKAYDDEQDHKLTYRMRTKMSLTI
jgi:hypothetical protein